MLDIISVAAQTVTTRNSVIFEDTRIKKGCNERHETGSGRVVLLKPGVYEVTFNADIAIPTGGVVGPISIGIVQDGEVIAGSVATITPAAVNAYGHVSTEVLAQVYGCGCGTSTISVIDTSTGSILVQNANLIVTRKC